MKVTIYKSYMHSRKDHSFELECQGLGTEEDPVLITSKNFPNSFAILESSLYIHIKDCRFNQFSCSLSKNIVLENCLLKSIELKSCSDIQIKNMEGEFFSIIKSNNCVFTNCICTKGFGFFKSNNNLIKNCTLKNRLVVKSSKGNIYENNQILEKYLPEIEEIDLIGDKNTFDFIRGRDSSGRKINEIECLGNGIEEDPFHIEPSEKIYKSLTILKSVNYLFLKSFNLKSLLLTQCRNITVEKCEIRHFHITYGLNIKIKDTFADNLILDTCDKIVVEDCHIGKLTIHYYKKNNIIFKNCKFKKINKQLLKQLELKLNVIE